MVLPDINLWSASKSQETGSSGGSYTTRTFVRKEEASYLSASSLNRSDRLTLDQLQNNNEEVAQLAFEALYREYAPELARFAYGYLKSRVGSEDVIADVFLSVWTRRGRLNPRGSIAAYLYTAVRNRALDIIRREKKAIEYRDRIIQSQPETIEVGSVNEENERLTTLKQAIANLPEDSRRLAELRWGRGMSAEEISIIFGVNRAAIDNRISRLVRRLQALVIRS